MPTWLRILCATDFSQSSRAALEHAADLARRLDAELALIHVREPPPPSELQLFSPPELAEADALEVQAALDAWRVEAERRSERPVRTVVERGSPATEIVATARDGDYDLVVTGTHARKGVRRVLLGSVAERVVREAPCAVLVAREPPDRGD